MDSHHSIPLLLSHRSKAPVTEDPSVRDEDMDASELVHRDLGEFLAVLSGAHGGCSLAARYDPVSLDRIKLSERQRSHWTISSTTALAPFSLTSLTTTFAPRRANMSA
jgi:hypothetical protein